MSIRKKNRSVVAPFVIAALSLVLLSLPALAADTITWNKVIDYGYPGYSEIGNAWRTYCGPAGTAHDGCYRYLSHYEYRLERKGTATWETEIPYSGIYRVKISFRATENRTPDADYYVDNGEGGQDHFSIDQLYERWEYLNGRLVWETLGEYQYNKGDKVKVILDGTDDTASDCADAASWELVKLTPPKGLARAAILRLLMKDKE